MVHREFVGLGMGRLALLLIAVTCPALQAQPLNVMNNSPVSALYGIPVHRDALQLPAGHWALDIQGGISNHFTDANRGGESVSFDGETTRLDMRIRYGLSERWELQVDIPWLQHRGGQLDELVEDWHKLFGLPGGGRSAAEQDQLHFLFEDGNGGRRNLRRSVKGMGEPSLTLSYQAWSEGGRQLSIAAGVRMGSGKQEDWLGSGETDYSLGLRFSDRDTLADYDMSWHLQGGVLRLGDSSLLPMGPESATWYASSSLDWRVNGTFTLVAQTDSHGRLYDSDLPQLGKPTFQLSLGAHWQASERWRMQLGFSEDLAVDRSPDISFFAGLSYRP